MSLIINKLRFTPQKAVRQLSDRYLTSFAEISRNRGTQTDRTLGNPDSKHQKLQKSVFKRL